MTQYKLNKDHICGHCVHFVICSKLGVKNVRYETDCCMWGSDHYQKEVKEVKPVKKRIGIQ